MTNENLKKDLDKLRGEINSVAGNDPHAKQRLNSLISNLEKRLEDSALAEDDDGLLENIREEISNFEAEHPRATAILNDIMVTLSNMGI